MTLDQQIEGVLFYKAAPVKKAALGKLFNVPAVELEEALSALRNRLQHGATVLVTTDTDVHLVTNPALDELIDGLRKDDLKRDIGKAGAETLAIILYRGPVSRADIDRIRGVNSSYILRNLLMRGLVERQTTGKTIQFTITTELLEHLGITDKTQLTNYESIMNALEKYETATAAESES